MADKTVVRGIRTDAWFGSERHTSWSLGPLSVSRMEYPANLHGFPHTARTRWTLKFEWSLDFQEKP